MPASMIRFERRDNTARQDLAMAAIAACRANRARGASVSRFFWSGPDAIVIFTEAEDAAYFSQAPDPESSKAMFALADLARTNGPERLFDPREGETTHRLAGR